jgi:hypothetical protein
MLMSFSALACCRSLAVALSFTALFTTLSAALSSARRSASGAGCHLAGLHRRRHHRPAGRCTARYPCS